MNERVSGLFLFVFLRCRGGAGGVRRRRAAAAVPRPHPRLLAALGRSPGAAGAALHRQRRAPQTARPLAQRVRFGSSAFFLLFFFGLQKKQKQNKTKKRLGRVHDPSVGETRAGVCVCVCVCVCSMTSRAGRTWKWLDLSHTLRRDRGIVFGVSSICDVETGRLFIFHSLLRPIRGARSTSQALHRRLAAVKKKHKCGLIGK